MFLLRLVFGLLLAAGLVSLALYLATGQPIWRRRGMIVIKWTVIAGLGAAAVILLERCTKLL
jgi:hypothetical protein